jgi:hypothetical protein
MLRQGSIIRVEVDGPTNRPPRARVKAKYPLSELREEGVLERYTPSPPEKISIVQVFGGNFLLIPDLSSL